MDEYRKMNSLDIRNQKLAELRAQKAKGIRRPIAAIEHLPQKAFIPVLEETPILTESPKDPFSYNPQALEEPFKPPTEAPPIADLDPQLTKLKHEFTAKKAISDRNQQEISMLQSLIQSKKTSITVHLQKIQTFHKEKQEIQSEISNLLHSQSSIRRSYTEKVPST